MHSDSPGGRAVELDKAVESPAGVVGSGAPSSVHDPADMLVGGVSWHAVFVGGVCSSAEAPGRVSGASLANANASSFAARGAKGASTSEAWEADPSSEEYEETLDRLVPEDLDNQELPDRLKASSAVPGRGALPFSESWLLVLDKQLLLVTPEDCVDGRDPAPPTVYGG